MPTLGLDFGTSNSAAGVMAGNRPYAIPLEDGKDMLPTAVFIDFAARRHVYGRAATRAMMEGQEGRFLRALKSILGTPLAQEQRRFLNERMSLIDVIARFLAEIRHRAETATGQTYEHALSGRPVRFHSASDARDAQAEADLRDAYLRAGFAGVDFLPEPEAAALAVEGTGRMLIVDIGGGTSDFTLCERDAKGTRVLASRGKRIGGTDFDKALSLSHVMPLLGHGATIGAEIGKATHTAPRALYNDLASWEKIAFVYDSALLRDVRKWVRLAETPKLFERLAEVLDMHLGHDIAYAVEAGKITANDASDAAIDLKVIQRGLSAQLTQDALLVALTTFADDIGACALSTVEAAGCAPQDVPLIVFVGGSSLMGVVRAAIAQRFPQARQEDAAVFTAVVHGLAHAAG